MRTARLGLSFAFVVAIAGLGCGGGAGPDVVPEAAVDAPTDMGLAEAGDVTDAARDAPPDAPPDAVDAPVADTADAAAPVCGNGRMEGSEACDDGNSQDGDGCNNNCTFSCRAAPDCDDHNACNGVETCDTVAHRCGAGTRAPDGTDCGTGLLCRAGACVPARCGDATTTVPEQCDDGNGVNGDGCDNDCTFSCTTGTDCSDLNLCNGNEVCTVATHTCTLMLPPAPDGTMCGAGNVCHAGACGPPGCGNGTPDPGEECDDGNATSGDGCNNDCRFTCTADPGCADGNACNGAETCTVATHRCAPGTAPADGAVCEADGNPGTRDVCRAGACRPSACGDGFVDPGRGETCEPPTAGCSPVSCTLAPTPSCGNGTVDPGEECDDHNNTRWDGCGATCRFEQTVRADTLLFLSGTAGCDLTSDGTVDNAIGRALSAIALDQLNTALRTSVSAGDTLVLAHFLDLDDRLGRNDPAVRMAFFSGTVAAPPFAGTRGEGFFIAAGDLDPAREPRAFLSPGSIAATNFTAGPGMTVLQVLLGGRTPQPLALYRATATGTIVADTTLNRIDGITAGRVCGAVRAGDLDRIPAPMGVPVGCLAAPPLNTSLLDVLVRGCNVFNLIVATQPDIDLDGDGLVTAMPALADTDGDHLVDTCRDGTGAVITGNDCAQDPRFDDAYSAAIGVTAVRVAITGVR